MYLAPPAFSGMEGNESGLPDAEGDPKLKVGGWCRPAPRLLVHSNGFCHQCSWLKKLLRSQIVIEGFVLQHSGGFSNAV